jgi:hypothetical protein
MKNTTFMSDIQIQDSYTNRPKFYKYESKDRQLLVDLLHESLRQVDIDRL